MKKINNEFKYNGVKYDVEITFRDYVNKKLKGFANATFKNGDEIFLIANDLQLIEGTKGDFIVEPKKFVKGKTTEDNKEYVTFMIPRDFKQHIADSLK